MGKLFELATSPTQYDSADTGFVAEASDVTSPSRAMFWSYLEPFSTGWKDKDIVDIGSGTGWLLNLLLQRGVHSAMGIEPSFTHVIHAMSHFPGTVTLHSRFEDVDTDQKFDVAIAIMSLVHVGDLSAFFQKLDSLMRPSGQLFAIIPDFDYYRSPRLGYVIHTEEIDPDEYAILIERQSGSIADVARTTKKYERVAVRYGFSHLKDVPLYPTQAYIETKPQYEVFRNTAINRLLIFKKGL